MKGSKNKRIVALTLTVSILLQSAGLLVLGDSASMRIPLVSATSSYDTWHSVQPLTIADDAQSSFWAIEHSGSGSIAAATADDYLNKETGSDSLKIVSSNGSYACFDICHRYEKSINLYMFSVFVLWWYGNGTNATFRLNLYTPDAENKLCFDFSDDFSGWRQLVFRFDKNFTSVGNANLSLLKEIHISLETANIQGTWYLDDVIADVISIPTPDTYLAEYEWALSRLLEHRDEKSGQVLASWGASNDSRDYEYTYRFDITLPTFTEAYKITGNETYLNAAKESFDKAITRLYNNETHLFSTAWNSTSETYVDELEILWGAITLESMYDFYSISLNTTCLTYANSFAKALHVYGINQTTNLPNRLISVSTGRIIARDAWVPMETGRLIGAYTKGYEDTSNKDFEVWAKDLAQAFWAKRNTTTNLFPLSIDSNGTALSDFCKPNLDPIQNVLLYAYQVTRDNFYLSLSVNITSAELEYAWSEELGRTFQSVWTNGSIRLPIFDLIDGPQMFIVGLLQLFHYTSADEYVIYAEKMWNTIHNYALVNDLYVTILDETNSPRDISSLYTQQMMVQCDAYMYYFTKNETYFEDLKNTIDRFLLHYRMPYGFAYSINATNCEIISDSTLDWLDSTSYTLGAAICAFSVYSTQSTTAIEADLTYYVPYYPMLKAKGSLNYANNQIQFALRGTTPCINVTFTLPQGKVVSTVAVNGSSIFLYSEDMPHLLIWEPGAYSINLTMKNGSNQNTTVNEFEFANYTLATTVETTNIANATIKLYIPFNETSQTPFPNDAWDVNCTEDSWGDSWNPASRILTVWAICNRSATIMILNMLPKAVELYDPEEVTEDSIKLVWEEISIRDFARYEVHMKADKTDWTLIQNITEKSNTTCRVTGLSPDTTYYFVVRTVDAGGLIADSPYISIKTKPSTVYRWLPVIILGMLPVIATLFLILRKRRTILHTPKATSNSSKPKFQTMPSSFEHPLFFKLEAADLPYGISLRTSQN